MPCLPADTCQTLTLDFDFHQLFVCFDEDG